MTTDGGNEMSYTPTTENIFDVALHGARAVSVEMSSVLNESEFRAQLDRWLAAHDAEVAAKAKIEALDWAAEHLSDGQKYEDVAALNSWEAVTVCAGVIRARAAEYRKAVQAE